MKYLIILLLCLYSIIIRGQSNNDSIKILYNKVAKVYDSLGLKNSEVDFLNDAFINFKPTYSKLLNLENLSNINLQKALVKDYEEKYSDAFISTIDTRKKLKILYNFTNKEEINNYIEKTELFLINNISYVKAIAIYNFYKNKSDAIENLINSNLKRLGISRKEYDEMSENDKSLLIEQFKE